MNNQLLAKLKKRQQAQGLVIQNQPVKQQGAAPVDTQSKVQKKDQQQAHNQFEQNKKRLKAFFQQKNGGGDAKTEHKTEVKKEQIKGDKAGFANARKLLQQKLEKPSGSTLPNLPPPPMPSMAGISLPPPPPPPNLFDLPLLPPPPSLDLLPPLPPPPSLDFSEPATLPPPPSLDSFNLPPPPPLPTQNTSHTTPKQKQTVNLPPPPTLDLPILPPPPVLHIPTQTHHHKQVAVKSVEVQKKADIKVHQPILPPPPPPPPMPTLDTESKTQKLSKFNSFDDKQVVANQSHNTPNQQVSVKVHKPVEQPVPKLPQPPKQQKDIKIFQVPDKPQHPKSRESSKAKKIPITTQFFNGVDVSGFIKRQFIKQTDILNTIGTKIEKKLYNFNFPSIENHLRDIEPFQALYADGANLDLVSCYMQKNVNAVRKHAEARQIFTNSLKDYNWTSDTQRLKLIRDPALQMLPKQFKYRQLNYVQIKNALNRCDNLIKSFIKFQNFEACTQIKKLREETDNLVKIYNKNPQGNQQLADEIEKLIVKIKDTKL